MFVKCRPISYHRNIMSVPNYPAATDTITFLGTAGARFMVIRQLASSGGIWLDMGGTRLLLDPGPGTIVQVARRKLDPAGLSGIILSHRHLDHSADVNVMVEAMTNGGHSRRGQFFAPADALGDEPVMYSYLKKAIEGITLLEAGQTYQVDGVTFSTSARHIHPVDTYGMVFRAAGHSFAYIADTRYFPDLHRSYAGAELLIINVVLTEPRPPIDHLSVPDAGRIIGEIRPRLAILTHFGMHVWQAGPQRIARELSASTKVKVIAARDGMVFDLAELDRI
jgi:ribonuclease BN (tRNA processing enzyme)